MQIELMTKSLIKTLLGISDTSYDTNIDLQLPIVSMDVRKYLNQNYQKYRTATYSAGENTAVIGGKMLDIGTVLQGTGIPDDTYITSYDYDEDEYTVNNTFTASDDDRVFPTISINQWNAIARMVMYKVSKMTVTSATEKDLVSKAIDSLSWTFADGEINKKYGYPQKLLDELGARFARVG